jgi:hypothetical protein
MKSSHHETLLPSGNMHNVCREHKRVFTLEFHPQEQVLHICKYSKIKIIPNQNTLGPQAYIKDTQHVQEVELAISKDYLPHIHLYNETKVFIRQSMHWLYLLTMKQK